MRLIEPEHPVYFCLNARHCTGEQILTVISENDEGQINFPFGQSIPVINKESKANIELIATLVRHHDFTQFVAFNGVSIFNLMKPDFSSLYVD